MAFAPPKTTEGAKLQTKMSTWTPLNHQLMNDKVFEERGALLGKWFDKWSDAQRRRVLCDLLGRCSVSQLRFCHNHLQEKVPKDSVDFTSVLPRVLALYIFSFLDPRSLCRCAQVSWHWKTLVELDQLWMPKCLRFGWCVSFSPTPYEQGVWKRQYIEMVNELHITRPKTPPREDFVVIDVHPIGKEIPLTKPPSSCTHRPVSGKMNNRGGKELPPWRSSDRHPTDTIRFNYLDNLDPIELTQQATRKIVAPALTPNQQNTEKKKRPTSASYKLRKAKSLISISSEFGKGRSRPEWATQRPGDYPVNKMTAESLARSTDWNAGIRPAPVRAGIPKLSEKGRKACTRTSPSSPTVALFESQPWQIPASNQGSDEE